MPSSPFWLSGNIKRREGGRRLPRTRPSPPGQDNVESLIVGSTHEPYGKMVINVHSWTSIEITVLYTSTALLLGRLLHDELGRSSSLMRFHQVSRLHRARLTSLDLLHHFNFHHSPIAIHHFTIHRITNNQFQTNSEFPRFELRPSLTEPKNPASRAREPQPVNRRCRTITSVQTKKSWRATRQNWWHLTGLDHRLHRRAISHPTIFYLREGGLVCALKTCVFDAILPARKQVGGKEIKYANWSLDLIPSVNL